MLDIIQNRHKDRYRIQFCHENFYREHFTLFSLWKTRFRSLSDVEKLQAWVLALSCLRRAEDWFGGLRKVPIRADLRQQHSLSLGDVFRDSPIMLPKKIDPEIDLLTFLNCYRIKALPESCFRSLCFICDGTYPLDVVSGEVSPLDLLQIQIEGRRVVALDEDVESWPGRLYADRDFLGFVLHDLIHADHFFHDLTHRDAQLGFYRLAFQLIQNSHTQELLKIAGFKKGFEYVISDMNAHPLHLLQTLHSLLFIHCRDDRRAAEIWKAWCTLVTKSESEAESLLRVNRPDFQTSDAKTIETLCLRLKNSNT